MVVLLLKLKRRISIFLNKVRVGFVIFELKHLYSGRFICDSDINLGKSFSINFDTSSSKIAFKKNIHFRDSCKIRSAMSSELSIGNNVFFNNNCSINCLSKITIGDNCLFGEAVRIYDHGHNYQEKNVNIRDQGFSFGIVVIGNNCWIGSNVVILKNVEIGDNVVIGAGCIIYKSIPSDTTVINKQSFNLINRNNS